jgi:hypothetical protein
VVQHDTSFHLSIAPNEATSSLLSGQRSAQEQAIEVSSVQVPLRKRAPERIDAGKSPD